MISLPPVGPYNTFVPFYSSYSGLICPPWANNTGTLRFDFSLIAALQGMCTCHTTCVVPSESTEAGKGVMALTSGP